MASVGSRFLIIKPSSLGDVVHALPVLAALRAAHPDAHIAWLAASAFAPLLEGHPLLDEVIRFDRRRYGRMWFDPAANVAFWGFVRGLRRRRFDCVIDLQGLLRSALLAWFSGAPRRVGFAGAREGAAWLYSDRVPVDADAHAVDRNVALARALPLTLETPAFPLAVTGDEIARAQDLLASAAGGVGPERFVAVLPGARWPSKQWSPEAFAAVIDGLAAEGRVSVLLGAPDEAALADRILGHCRSAPLNLVGRTSLRTLTAVLALAERVVCCDSGPMHVAAALGRPVVAVFGPTSPGRTGPYDAGARVVSLGLACSPCYRRVCPLGHQDCLGQLAAREVLAAVRK